MLTSACRHNLTNEKMQCIGNVDVNPLPYANKATLLTVSLLTPSALMN